MMNEYSTNRRVLAVDPGEKRLGIALSDPTATIANPLMVMKHINRAIDAATIAQLAQEHQVNLIVIGQALDDDNQSTQQRRAWLQPYATRLRYQLSCGMKAEVRKQRVPPEY